MLIQPFNLFIYFLTNHNIKHTRYVNEFINDYWAGYELIYQPCPREKLAAAQTDDGKAEMQSKWCSNQ